MVAAIMVAPKRPVAVSRRRRSVWRVVVWSTALFAPEWGCEHQAAPATATNAPPKPLNFIERVTGNPESGASLPLVVALHGRGDTPEGFTERLSGYTHAARFVYLEAPIDEGKGRGWFTFDPMPGSRKRTTAKVRRLVDRLMVSLDRIEASSGTQGKPVLLGFSQGAMVVYAAALAHPERFAAALPVSGALFETLIPEDMGERGPKLPPVIAFHGEDDPVIPARASVRAIDTLKAAGASAEIRRFAGVPHWITGDMKKSLLSAIATFTHATAQAP